MHKFFASWCQEVDVNPDPEAMKAHASVIEAEAKKIDVRKAIEMVKFMVFPQLGRGATVEDLCVALQKANPSFPMKDNARALSVFAGALLAEVLEQRKDEVADAAALATTCGCFLPHASSPPVKDVLGEAEEYLRKRSCELREDNQPEKAKPQSVNVAKALDDHLAKCQEPNLPSAELVSPFVDAIKQIATAVNAISSVREKALADSVRLIRLLQEEVNILWWVFGEASKDLSVELSKVEATWAPILVGKELADLVQIVPGPMSAGPMLKKMLTYTKGRGRAKVSLASSVNACSREWREDLGLKDQVSKTGPVCPVHLALSCSLATDGDDDWMPVFRKAAGQDTDVSKLPVEIALQMYRERLLMRPL